MNRPGNYRGYGYNKPLPRNNGPCWSSAMVAELKQHLEDAELTHDEIAEAMGRTPYAITCRIEAANLDDRDLGTRQALKLLEVQNRKVGEIALALAGHTPPQEGEEGHPWCLEAICTARAVEQSGNTWWYAVRALHGIKRAPRK